MKIIEKSPSAPRVGHPPPRQPSKSKLFGASKIKDFCSPSAKSSTNKFVIVLGFGDGCGDFFRITSLTAKFI
jgi:hypothetical protein